MALPGGTLQWKEGLLQRESSKEQVRIRTSQPAQSPHKVTLIDSGDVWPGLQRSQYLPQPLRPPSLGRVANSLMSVLVLEVLAVLMCRARPKCRFTRRQFKGSYHRKLLSHEGQRCLETLAFESQGIVTCIQSPLASSMRVGSHTPTFHPWCPGLHYFLQTLA